MNLNTDMACQIDEVNIFKIHKPPKQSKIPKNSYYLLDNKGTS